MKKESIKELLNKHREAYAVTKDICSKMEGRVVYYIQRGCIGKGQIKGLQTQTFTTLHLHNEQYEESVTVLEELVFDTFEEAVDKLWGGEE